MAEKRQPAYRRQVYSGQTYVQGSSIRKQEELPRSSERVHREPKKVSRQVRKNRRNALRMSKRYVVFLAIAAVFALVVCVNYLRLQSELAANSRQVASMQKELADIRELNTTKFNNAIDSANLEEIRRKAVETLGMTHVKAEQIITYKNPAGNYVKQYKDIPKNGISARSENANK